MPEPAPEAPPQYLVDLVVRNAVVVTMDEQHRVLASGALCIDQGEIVWIGNDVDVLGVPSEQVIDAHGAIVMPGMVDTHFHTGQHLMRGLIAEVAQRTHVKLPVWRNYNVPFETSLTEDDVLLSGRLAYANMLRAGTTCFSDAGGPHPDQMAKAALETGIRGFVALSTMDMGDNLPAGSRMTTAEAIDRNIELVKRWSVEGEGRVGAYMSLRQIIVCTPELWRAFAEISAELGCRVHTHLAEGTYEVDFTTEHYGLRPAEWLDSIGFLSERSHLAHSILLTDDEVVTMGARRVSVGHCPQGNFRIGSPKVNALRRAGARVGLGSDGAISGAIDLLQSSRALRTGLQATFGTPWHEFSTITDVDLLHLCTLGGADALGLGAATGSLEVGKRADLLVVDNDALEMLPAVDPVFVLTRCATGHDVRTVVVDGRIVMRDGRLLTVDEEALRAEVRVRSRSIMNRFEAAAA